MLWPSLQSRRQNHCLHLLYKIMTDLLPPYLKILLSMRVANRARYVPWASLNVTVRICKTISFSRSFLQYTVNERNRLDPEVRCATNLQIFRRKYFVRHEHRNNLFYYGSHSVNIQMARIRIGCSSLLSHLGYNLHVEDNPKCKCGISEEDCEHYFFHCPVYVNQRKRPFRTVDQTTLSVSIILREDEIISFEENIPWQHAVYQYIIDTWRFPMLS